MRKRIAAAVVGVALVSAPAVAQGRPLQTDNQPRWRPYEKRYLVLRHDYVKRFGLQAAGRNIVRYGFRERDGEVHPATRTEVVRSADRMDGALHPTPASAPTASTPASTATASYGSSASSSTIQCESGGDYTADTGNGYYGAYQFDQGTWDAYAPSGYAGTNPAAAPPAVQDAAAANVPYDAWPSC